MKRLPIAAWLLLGSFCWAQDASMSTSSTTATPTAPKAAEEGMPKSGIDVMKLAICRDVKDRECVDPVTTAKLGESLVGWSQVRSGLGEVTIVHRWLHGGETLSSVPLVLKGSPYRTWSRKTLTEAGEWTLQVLNPEGEVLEETKVTVEK
jgi:hypothetical protein